MATSENLQRILKQLHTRENAVVADMLRNAGYRYKTIFGATIVDLRTMAKEYAPNHELALELWERDYRETKILALLIEDASKITKEQMDKWVNEFHTIEQVEQATYQLFPRAPFAEEQALTYCQRDNDLIKATGFLMAAKRAQLQLSDNEEFFGRVLSLSIEPSIEAGVNLKRTIATALRLIGRKNENLKQKAIQTAQAIKAKETPSALEIADEALFELTTEF
jgi:3-methyladenine DNA glycosylase AlkD